jgi:hypothetical protein
MYYPFTHLSIDISNNRIFSPQKMRAVKKLKNLLVLDYAGNPLAQNEESFHFIAFVNSNIKNLKEDSAHKLLSRKFRMISSGILKNWICKE